MEKLKLLKGTRFTSFLFIAFSLLIAAGILWGANMYYDIDAGKIIVNEIQRVVKSGAIALEVVGITKLGSDANYAQFAETGDLAFYGTADVIEKSDAALTIQTTGQNLTVRTTTSGTLALTSAGALDIDASGAITIDTASGNAITINATGANLTLRTTTSGDIILDPASGTISLGAGDQIKTSGGGAASRLSGEQILREVVPIFGFDLPARTGSTTYVTLSRKIESYPFSACLTGTSRIHKFIIRYADTLDPADTNPANQVSNWQTFNTTTGASVATFNVPASPQTTETGLEDGVAYLTGPVAIPVPAGACTGYSSGAPTDDWVLQVKLPTTGKKIQVYQIFLAAYDQVL